MIFILLLRKSPVKEKPYFKLRVMRVAYIKGFVSV